MALMQCPECGREVSDKAESCPNCGYILSESSSDTAKRSKLSEPVSNNFYGLLFIFTGVIFLIAGIFTIGIIIGIVFILFGIAGIGAGIQRMGGLQKGNCPYCKQPVEVPVNDGTFKCPHCKKISTHTGSYLETII